MPTKTAVKKPAATSRKPRSKYIPGQYVYAFGEAYGLGKPLRWQRCRFSRNGSHRYQNSGWFHHHH